MMQREIFVISFYFILYASKINCDMMPILRVEMNNIGFHRDLQYTIEFDYPLAGKDCELYLEQKLPAAVYISVDQLDDLKRLKKLDAIYPHFVDVEIPTEKANELTVLILSAPRITENIKLPIHFRYHSPGEESFANVEIITPEMYMRCPDDDLSNYDDLLEDQKQNFCLNDGKFHLVELRDQQECDWKHLKKTLRLKAPLVSKIPIGNAKSFPAVFYATIIISWIVSFWFVLATQATLRKINFKLEQQRVLDKKYNN